MKFKDYVSKDNWENNLDKDIPKELMKKLNSIKWMNIVSSCDGHGDGPSLFFEIDRKFIKFLYFDDVREFFDKFIEKIDLEGTHVNYICWLNPTEFLYDSDNGFNAELLKKYKINAKKSLYYKVIVQLKKKNSEDSYNWWMEVYNKMSELNPSIDEETTREILQKNRSNLKNYMDLLQLDDRVMTIVFTKKDGSERTMRCTRNLKLIPNNAHPKGTGAPKAGVLSAFDLDKKEWRSFRLSSLVSIS